MFRAFTIAMFCILITGFPACKMEGPGVEEPEPLTITDELFPRQWYIKNGGGEGQKKGIDINVLPVWEKGYTGKGIIVGVVDSGLDSGHPDLKENFPASNLRKGAITSDECSHHGSQVMGIIAARDNDIGIRGIAPRARLYGYDFASFIPDSLSYSNFSDKISELLIEKELPDIAAWNLSLGTPHEFRYEGLSNKQIENLDTVLETGFYGQGSSLVFAAGNLAGLYWGNASNSDFNNHYGVMAVNAVEGNGQLPSGGGVSVNHTVGTNIWVIAPTGGISTSNTGCKDQENDPGDYSSIDATSGAAPMVTGVVALLRGAYPKLTWRDVKLIIAESARKISISSKEDFISSGYQESGRMYHDRNKTQSYHRLAGFGLVDAARAFEIAEDWKLLPPMETEVYEEPNVKLDTSADKMEHETTLEVSGSEIGFVESVILEMDIVPDPDTIFFQGNLTLRSPDGKGAHFYDYRSADNRGPELAWLSTNELLLLTNRFLGSSSVNGSWKLGLEHRNEDGKTAINEITSWQITIRGH